MHLYVMARGERAALERYIRDIEAQKYEHVFPDGLSLMCPFQVREIKLLEFAFHKEQKNRALSLVHPTWYSRKLEPMICMLRKILGAKKCNKVYAPSKQIRRDNICVVPVGIRDDGVHETAKWEML